MNCDAECAITDRPGACEVKSVPKVLPGQGQSLGESVGKRVAVVYGHHAIPIPSKAIASEFYGWDDWQASLAHERETLSQAKRMLPSINLSRFADVFHV